MQSSKAVDLFRRLLPLLLVASVIAPLGPDAGAASAAGRSWQVTASCGPAVSGAAHPEVSVAISNNTGLPLHVAYAHGFATAPAIGTVLQGLALEDPGPQAIVDIPDGASKTLPAPWAGGGSPEKPGTVALVVTSGGFALTGCGDRATSVPLPGPLPTVSGEEGIESATIAAKTIGQLESWRAYAPLYALIHADSQAQFSFGQVACWYVGQYGLPGARDSTTIYSTDVRAVTFVDWTWAGGLTKYTRVAEVSLSQTTGVFPKSGEQTVRGVEHLVRVDGVWRWFFGTAVDSTAHLTASCGLPAST